MSAVKPRKVLKDSSLYICDNGACYCGFHAGYSAQFSGRDISGQEVLEITPDIQAYAIAEFGSSMTCESCDAA